MSAFAFLFGQGSIPTHCLYLTPAVRSAHRTVGQNTKSRSFERLFALGRARYGVFFFGTVVPAGEDRSPGLAGAGLVLRYQRS